MCMCGCVRVLEPDSARGLSAQVSKHRGVRPHARQSCSKRAQQEERLHQRKLDAWVQAEQRLHCVAGTSARVYPCVSALCMRRFFSVSFCCVKLSILCIFDCSLFTCCYHDQDFCAQLCFRLHHHRRFWQMVWMSGSTCIVMVTNEVTSCLSFSTSIAAEASTSAFVPRPSPRCFLIHSHRIILPLPCTD